MRRERSERREIKSNEKRVESRERREECCDHLRGVGVLYTPSPLSLHPIEGRESLAQEAM